MSCINCGDQIESREGEWAHTSSGTAMCKMMPRTPGNVIYLATPGGDGLSVGLRNALNSRTRVVE